MNFINSISGHKNQTSNLYILFLLFLFQNNPNQTMLYCKIDMSLSLSQSLLTVNGWFSSLYYFLVYQGGVGQNVTQYEQSIMGQAIYLKGQEYVDLHGIPADFWSGDEWSVMTLMKIYPEGLNNNDVPIIGDGEPASNKGFHLGVRDQVLISLSFLYRLLIHSFFPLTLLSFHSCRLFLSSFISHNRIDPFHKWPPPI